MDLGLALLVFSLKKRRRCKYVVGKIKGGILIIFTKMTPSLRLKVLRKFDYLYLHEQSYFQVGIFGAVDI